jgi:hypothetical protein
MFDKGYPTWTREGGIAILGRRGAMEEEVPALLLRVGPSLLSMERRQAMSGNDRPMVPKPCLWPLTYGNSCGELSVKGRLCTKHLARVWAYAGKWECAWPQCQRLSPAKRGLCSFHSKVAAGETGQ